MTHNLLFDNPSSYSLIDRINENEDQSDIINEPELFNHSWYYSIDSFINMFNNKVNGFSILSLNCQSLNAKFSELKILIEDFKNQNINLSAICLQETWLSEESDTSLLQLENYTLIHKGKSCSAHGGVAIYLHDSFTFKMITVDGHSNSWDGLFIQININASYCNSPNNAKNILLGNIYRPPRSTVSDIQLFTQEITQVFNEFNHYKHVALCGDFNIDLLKYKEINSIGEYFENFLTNSYIPKLTFPTRLTHKHGTLIDQILVKLSDNFSQTTSGILTCSISDHFPCFVTLDYFNIKYNYENVVKIYPKYDEAVSDLCKFLNDSNILNLMESSDDANPNKNYEMLSNLLCKGMDIFFPVKVVRYNKYKNRKTPWITKGIIKSIKYRDKLYTQLKKTDLNSATYNSLKINLQTYNRILRQSIRSAKKIYYHNCFSQYKNDIKQTWSTIKNIMNRNNKCKEFPKFFLINGQYKSDPCLIAEEFNRYFINVGPELAQTVSNSNNQKFSDFLNPTCNLGFNFQSITPVTTLKIIEELKPKTSSGKDKLSNKLLKSIKNEIVEPLTVIINQSFKQGIFPDLLKIAKVTPLYKKNEDYKFSNYRPISILPSLSKVFEKCMHKQIYDFFDANKLFYSSQYGFRRSHSTEYAAFELVDKILHDLDNGQIPISVFLDLSKAFDTLNHSILITKLKYYGFQNNAIKLMESYLSNRYQYVELNGIRSSHLLITTGVPQGSILGPLLFIIYMNDIANASSLFYPILYADDTTLSATLKTFNLNNNAIASNINVELDKISLWLKVNKLSLNTEKTKAMLFHMPQKTVNYPDIYINQVKIEFVKQFNFLGIILDDSMKLKSHMNHIVTKISKVVGIINKLKNFLPRGALLNIYNALIVPHLNYGVLLLSKHCDKLFLLQKKAIRAVSCAKYNAHTDGLFISLHVLKVHDICALHALKFCFKLENGLLPDFFHQPGIFIKNRFYHNYDSRRNNDYVIPLVKHEFAKSGMRYIIPHYFNQLDICYKEKIYTHSINGLKFYFKNTQISKYSRICNIPSCYICQN